MNFSKFSGKIFKTRKIEMYNNIHIIKEHIIISNNIGIQMIMEVQCTIILPTIAAVLRARCTHKYYQIEYHQLAVGPFFALQF